MRCRVVPADVRVRMGGVPVRLLQQWFTAVTRRPNKFDDLPVFAPQPMYPVADGDMAELEQLQAEILESSLGDPMADYAGWFRRYSMLSAAAHTTTEFHTTPWPVSPTFNEMWDAAAQPERNGDAA